VLPGSERGVVHCLAAADRAEQAAAHEETAAALRMALDLLPASDGRRPRLLARLGLGLAWSLKNEEAVRVASEAGELLAASEGSDAAADYLADSAAAVYGSAFDPRGWVLAEQGLRHVGTRRELTWAGLAALDLVQREANDPTFPGFPLDVPVRHEISRIVLANPPLLLQRVAVNPGMQVVFSRELVFKSREDAIARGRMSHHVMAFVAGEYARALALGNQFVPLLLERGQLAPAVVFLTGVAHCQSALGNLEASREAFGRASELGERVGNPPLLALVLAHVQLDHAFTRGEGYGLLLPGIEQSLAKDAPENRWLRSLEWARAASAYAHEGRRDDALRALEQALPAIERCPGWAWAYAGLIGFVIEALWVLERRDHVEVLERNLRAKTLAPDFRSVGTDARLSLARLCALTGRFDEAREWFEKARNVLDEQGARPLRAITDFGEAWMEVRRGGAGDRQRALALLDAARGPFESIGMPGWLRRAEELRQRLAP
jgi:tetratricopeptide (TPR) repeat protein